MNDDEYPVDHWNGLDFLLRFQKAIIKKQEAKPCNDTLEEKLKLYQFFADKYPEDFKMPTPHPMFTY